MEFFRGTRLIIQGPADVELQSENSAFCRRGRFSAHVPAPARGFRLGAPGVAVTDLGTEFGLNVPEGGPPEVHEFAGEVEAAADGGRSPAVRLSAGQAVRAEGPSLRAMPADRAAFLDEPGFARLASGDRRRRHNAWAAAAEALSRDPTALAHDTFESADRSVPDRAGASPPAAIVGCGREDGRWPGTPAVVFAGPGDRVRLDVPGKFSAVTLLAWVRVDALPGDLHSLVTPDGAEEGTVRWNLGRDGGLRLGIARRSDRPEPDWEVVIGPPPATPRTLGRWTLLASTFDGKTIRHYVDRRRDGQVRCGVQPGPAADRPGRGGQRRRPAAAASAGPARRAGDPGAGPAVRRDPGALRGRPARRSAGRALSPAPPPRRCRPTIRPSTTAAARSTWPSAPSAITPLGFGEAGKAPPLLDSDRLRAPEQRLVRMVLHGVRGPITVVGLLYNADESLEMPAAAGALDDGQIAAVRTYVRREWGEAAPPVEPAVVTAVRAATKDRTQPWTEKELLRIK